MLVIPCFICKKLPTARGIWSCRSRHSGRRGVLKEPAQRSLNSRADEGCCAGVCCAVAIARALKSAVVRWHFSCASTTAAQGAQARTLSQQ